MVARSIPELEKIWVSLEHSKRFSDGLISIGGVGLLGVNGLIAMASSAFSLPVEVLFEAYTAITALYLLGLAASARASPGTMIKVLIFIAADAGLDLVPVFGGFADAVLRAPGWRPARFRRRSNRPIGWTKAGATSAPRGPTSSTWPTCARPGSAGWCS